MKRKICLCLEFLMILIVCLSAICINGYAATADYYYENEYGLKLTEEQYNELAEYLDECEINNLYPEEYEYMISNSLENCILGSETTYVESTYTELENGEIECKDRVLKNEELVSKLFEDKFNKNNPMLMRISPRPSDSAQTTMKKLTMTMTQVQASHKKAIFTCEWLSIPKVKSFDVIGMRPEQTAMTIDGFETTNVQGHQYYDGNTIAYGPNNGNIKYTSTGLGISMNIVDSVSTSLKCDFAVTFGSGATIFTVHGTYQHAVTNVTLSESKNYTIMATGMGNVLNFASSVWNKYDNSPELYVIGIVPSELNN